jgi:endonuclease YncB( thermonuclease family)
MTYAAAGKWTFYGSTLNRITDGDSFYANVAAMFDFGFHITIGGSATQKFRVNGCNAAPLSHRIGSGCGGGARRSAGVPVHPAVGQPLQVR